MYRLLANRCSGCHSHEVHPIPYTQSPSAVPHLPEKGYMSHPLQHGQVFFSPGCHFSYRVIGACCRLFDREQLPYPCCRLQWRGKEPSWRRIGKRFIVDLSTKKHPSYSVEILGQGLQEPIVITLYAVNLSEATKNWWHSDRPEQRHGKGAEEAREHLSFK